MTAADWGLIVVFVALVALIVWLLVQDDRRGH